MKGSAPISAELAAFLESGLSITAGTRDRELNPDGARAWAARVDEDRTHLTVFIHAKAAPALLRNLESCPEVALAFDRPVDNRACQVKGRFESSRRARPDERAEVERQAGGFLSQLDEIGIPRALTAGWKVWPAVAIRLRVTELFEQTPGPGAGEPLR
ncbi:MAG: pyridoxamine 5'-phosphate oxidase family protein [Acidobacteria bacterium]|jgi:hypothetical protein|nr:pyridoxamine 5'-phosphate oxidase family protein [Acidobacteriota bacterium]